MKDEGSTRTKTAVLSDLTTNNHSTTNWSHLNQSETAMIIKLFTGRLF